MNTGSKYIKPQNGSIKWKNRLIHRVGDFNTQKGQKEPDLYRYLFNNKLIRLNTFEPINLPPNFRGTNN